MRAEPSKTWFLKGDYSTVFDRAAKAVDVILKMPSAKNFQGELKEDVAEIIRQIQSGIEMGEADYNISGAHHALSSIEGIATALRLKGLTKEAESYSALSKNLVPAINIR